MNNKDYIKQLNDNGYVIMEDILTKEETTVLRNLLDELDKKNPPKTNSHTMHKRLFEISPKECINIFKKEKVLSFVKEAIGMCGTGRNNDNSLDVHVIHNNAFCVKPGTKGQATTWHTDDPPIFMTTDNTSLPDNVIIAPLVLTCMYYLNDVRGEIDGMTHIIPGSHRFGGPCYEHIANNLPYIVPEIKEGSVMIFSSGLWHKGCDVSPEGNSRYVFQVSYGRRLIGHKHDTIMNYQLPKNVEDLLETKEERKLMGFLKGGSYS